MGRPDQSLALSAKVAMRESDTPFLDTCRFVQLEEGAMVRSAPVACLTMARLTYFPQSLSHPLRVDSGEVASHDRIRLLAQDSSPVHAYTFPDLRVGSRSVRHETHRNRSIA